MANKFSLTSKSKKLAIIISVVIVAIIAVGTGVFAYARDVAEKNSIGIDNAINIAMTDAGATQENTTVTKAKMDFEKGVFVYEIDFTVNGTDEYEYSIKASDGTILDKDWDTVDRWENPLAGLNNTSAAPNETTAQTEQNTAQVQTLQDQQASSKADTTVNNAAEISLDKAKSIALSKAGVSKDDAKFTSAHKDSDDGAFYYEIEFVTSSFKYEYEIDLKGNVISYDRDPIKKASVSASSPKAKYIGADKAKSIALDNAGVSSKNVTFTKAKLEFDNAAAIYDIEFVTSSQEYEYEINAVSGKIISHSSEPLEVE